MDGLDPSISGRVNLAYERGSSTPRWKQETGNGTREGTERLLILLVHLVHAEFAGPEA